MLTNTAKLCAEVLILPDYKGVLIPPFSGVLNPLLERAYSPPVYTPRYRALVPLYECLRRSVLSFEVDLGL